MTAINNNVRTSWSQIATETTVIVFDGPGGGRAELYWENNQFCFRGDIEQSAEELFKFLSASWFLREIKHS